MKNSQNAELIPSRLSSLFRNYLIPSTIRSTLLNHSQLEVRFANLRRGFRFPCL